MSLAVGLQLLTRLNTSSFLFYLNSRSFNWHHSCPAASFVARAVLSVSLISPRLLRRAPLAFTVLQVDPTWWKSVSGSFRKSPQPLAKVPTYRPPPSDLALHWGGDSVAQI